MGIIEDCYRGVVGDCREFELRDYPRYLRLIIGYVRSARSKRLIGYITLDCCRRVEVITRGYCVIDHNSEEYWADHYVEVLSYEDRAYIFRDRLSDGGVRSIILDQERAEELFSGDGYYKKLCYISRSTNWHEGTNKR